jgi:hypothetical protein
MGRLDPTCTAPPHHAVGRTRGERAAQRRGLQQLRQRDGGGSLERGEDGDGAGGAVRAADGESVVRRAALSGLHGAHHAARTSSSAAATDVRTTTDVGAATQRQHR